MYLEASHFRLHLNFFGLYASRADRILLPKVVAEFNCCFDLRALLCCFLVLHSLEGFFFFCYGQCCVRVDMIVSVAKLLVIVCCCFVTMQVAREFKALLFWKRFW